MINLKWDIWNIPLPYKAQETLQKKGQEDLVSTSENVVIWTRQVCDINELTVAGFAFTRPGNSEPLLKCRTGL